MMLETHPRVAIFQLGVIPGGRLRVIIEIARMLNEMDIVPDLLTTRIALSPDQIATKYGQSITINIRLLPRIPRFPHDFLIPYFNALLNFSASNYDLLINSNNSLYCLPKRKKVISYVHFPHKRRIMDDSLSIHRPSTRLSRWSRGHAKRVILRAVYHFSKPKPDHMIVCNSKYTSTNLMQVYDIQSAPVVIYPPVDFECFANDKYPDDRERQVSVVTIGRFGPDKRQFEQIMLAEKLPGVDFHIIGFVNNFNYYEKCRRYQEKHKITNVHLYPDAPFEQMVALLKASKYFLHTLINEPFGITTVQAISAGCLPIVHDSGGQQEVVPIAQLRYRHFDEIPPLLEKLEGADYSETRSLLHHLQERMLTHFEASTFRRSFRKILEAELAGII